VGILSSFDPVIAALQMETVASRQNDSRGSGGHCETTASRLLKRTFVSSPIVGIAIPSHFVALRDGHTSWSCATAVQS
jgi:hypothetical protein